MKRCNTSYLKQNGLSLIELLITLVVVAILSIIAIPNLSKPINQNNLLAVRDGLIRDLNHAKNSASRMGVSIQVVFDRIVPGCGSGRMAWALIRVSNNEALRCQPVNSNLLNKIDISYAGTLREWIYLPNGLANSTRDLEITFERGTDNERVNIFAGGFVNYENQ